MIPFYILIAVLWLLIFGGLSLLASKSWRVDEREDAPKLARIAVGAPVWPVLLAFFLVRSLIRIVRLAVKGYPQ